MYCQPLVPSPHIVATCSHTHSYILYISPCGHRNSYPHPSPCFQSYEQLHDMLLVSFFSPVMHMWTSLFCMDLDPAAGLLQISAFCFCFTLGPEWVEWGVLIYFLLLSSLSGFVVFWVFFLFPPVSPPSSAAHPPSKDKATPSVFASSCAAWTFGGWKFQSSPPHPVCVSFSFFCHDKKNSEETFSPHSRPNVGKWTATKSFLAIILFLALCRQPHSVSRKLCVKEWLPVSSPER